MPKSAVVDTFMASLDHPFKAEIAAVRSVVLAAHPQIRERIKWRAPSFYYRSDIGAFNLHAADYAHLILVFPHGQLAADPTGLLAGAQKDRREIRFSSVEDVLAKAPALTALLREWIAGADKAALEAPALQVAAV